MTYDRDYYAVLGIASDSDEKAIKRSYRSLARRYHPDVSREVESMERFREIQEAYELLLDPEQRRAYDHWREQQWTARAAGLVLQMTPSHELLPSIGEPQLLYLLLQILASEGMEGHRLPLNLCLVVDQSTSMRGGRLQQVKEAARYIVDRLQPEDVLSLVTFHDRATVVLPGRPGIDRSAARLAINQIESGGGTEILHGLKLGWEQIRRWQGDNVLSHLILLTDGQTYGDEKGCLEMARLAASEQVSLTLMGVGTDWNDKLLDQMAELAESPGGSVYIDTPDKIVKTFHDRIESLGSVYAQRLALSLHLSEGATLKDSFRISPTIGHLAFVDERARLGALEKGRPQEFILELLVESKTPGEHRLAQIDLEGILPAGDRQTLRSSHSLTVTFDTHLDRVSSIPADIASAMRRLAIFKMQERAMADVEQGRMEQACDRLKALATRLLDVGETELARAALLEASSLAQTGSVSPAGRKKIRYGTRGLRILSNGVHND
jgi:Ca-activated chloride channel homolog